MRRSRWPLVACAVVALLSESLSAQDENAVDIEQADEVHDPDDPLLPVKLAWDRYVSEWWNVGLNYACRKGVRRVQERNFERQYARRIGRMRERLQVMYGPDVTNHGHDVIAIGRCIGSAKAEALPATIRQFEAQLSSMESLLGIGRER